MTEKTRQNRAIYMKEYWADRRKRFPDQIRENSRRGNQRLRRDIRDFCYTYKLGHPCIDCGITDPDVLDFDHRNWSDKSFSVGKAPSIKRLIIEIQKCDIRCANCHRRRTKRQLQEKGIVTQNPQVTQLDVA